MKSSDYILEISRDYSIYVNSNRAIPNVSDGLKDAQRKALWLLRTKSSKMKTIALTGEMFSSNLYVHGDSSANSTISLLAAPFVNNIPLIEGIGEFGSRISPIEGIAAPRYTSIKRSKFAEKVLYQDLNIVPMKENYDGSTMEPETFLPIIPTILLNGVSGVGVGWSTEVLPRKLEDIVRAMKNHIDGKRFNRLKPYYGYLNVDVELVEDNVWKFYGKVEFPDTSTIRVTELPPDLTLEQFKTRLNKMEDDGEIKGYVDRSTEYINVHVKMNRGKVRDWDEAKAIDFLKLGKTKTERIVVIDWNGKSIKQYETAEEVIKDFVDWRLKHYTTRFQTLVVNDSEELLYWKGLKMCFDKKLPSFLGSIKDRDAIKTKISDITKSLKLTDDVINKIVELSTYRWAQDYYKVVLDNIKRLEDNIKEYNAILKDDAKLRGVFKDELDQIK